MIKLDPQFIVQTQIIAGGQVAATITTDTLCLSQFAADFNLGTLYATIQRGTITDGVFTANQPPYVVTVDPDGSFTVADGNSGSLPGLAAFIASMKSQLDAFILASGLVTGTTE